MKPEPVAMLEAIDLCGATEAISPCIECGDGQEAGTTCGSDECFALLYSLCEPEATNDEYAWMLHDAKPNSRGAFLAAQLYF